MIVYDNLLGNLLLLGVVGMLFVLFILCGL